MKPCSLDGIFSFKDYQYSWPNFRPSASKATKRELSFGSKTASTWRRGQATGVISSEDLHTLQRYMVNLRDKDAALQQTEAIYPGSELRVFTGEYDDNLGIELTRGG